MNAIILASHGELSVGMKQTASMIIGSAEHLYALSAYRDEDESIGQQLEKVLKEVQGKAVYILTDILGGSVNNEMLQVIQRYPTLHLITGMNLPLVISLAMQTQNVSEDELAQIIKESQASLLDCKQLLANSQIGGDDL